MNKEIVLATNNKHKLKEFREILSPLGYVVYCPSDLNINVDPEETGSTYFENSEIKARAIAKLVPFPVIADDSGLEVLGLNRFPGIYSARFADQFNGDYQKAGDDINRQLGDSKERKAEFHCVICLLEKFDSKPLFFEGVCKGSFLQKSQGINGFGYDPFFYSDELKGCIATYPEEEKNKISHRAKALKKLLVYLSIK